MKEDGMKLEEQTLAEIRALNSKFDELSLQIRIDTPWTRIRSHLRYAMLTLSEIPAFTRLCFLAAVILLSVAVCFTMNSEARKKLLMGSLNLAMLGMTWCTNYG